MFNIILGIVFIVGGLSGKLALRGTDSGPLLAALGAGLLAWGGYQMWKKKQQGTTSIGEEQK